MPRIRRIVFLAALILAGLGVRPSALAAGLSAPERRIVAAAEAETDRSIALLERMVNQNSGTMNLEGVRRVGEMMHAELEPLGFQVRWIPMAETGRAGHLVATHPGRGRGKRMLLIGHLDTVFEVDSPFQRFVRRGDIAEGPGVNDMKGGLVVMVAALRAMQAAGALRDAHITIVLTGDEERVGTPQATARRDLMAAADQSDVALEFETLARDGDRDMGSIARRSSATWTLLATAKSGHSSGVFSEGAGFGAIYEVARVLDAFRRELREPGATYSVGLVLGGAEAGLNAAETGGQAAGKSNVIPATAIARGDLRTLSNEQAARIIQRMQAIVAEHLPGTSAELSFSDGYPAMPPTEGSRALLKVLNQVNADLGLPPMGELDPLRRGAGDIAFVADKVEGGLIGLGAAGEGAHAPGETVDLTSLERQAKRAALLMTRLSR